MSNPTAERHFFGEFTSYERQLMAAERDRDADRVALEKRALEIYKSVFDATEGDWETKDDEAYYALECKLGHLGFFVVADLHQKVGEPRA